MSGGWDEQGRAAGTASPVVGAAPGGTGAVRVAGPIGLAGVEGHFLPSRPGPEPA